LSFVPLTLGGRHRCDARRLIQPSRGIGSGDNQMIIRGGDAGNPGVRKLQLADSGPRDPSMIVPVIKQGLPASDDAIVLPPELRPIAEHLVAELNVMYAFDLPGHFEYLSEQHCRNLGLDPAVLRKLSVRNLTRRRSKPEILRPSGAVHMFRLDGELETSLLLVDHLWPQAARAIPGDIVAGVPSRNVLVITGTGISGGIDTLRWAVDRAWQRRPNPKTALTRSLLIRRDDSWQLLDRP
jgi:hypothetical protein